MFQPMLHLYKHICGQLVSEIAHRLTNDQEYDDYATEQREASTWIGGFGEVSRKTSE